MDIEQILKKFKDPNLGSEERKELFKNAMGEIEELKTSNPEEYLNLVKTLNSAFKEINATLRKVI